MFKFIQGMTRRRLAGPGFIILNVMRAMNIIGLLAVVAASIIMVVRTFTKSKFYFFDGATHIITAFSSMFLVLSECGFFKGYFSRNWPMLSHEHGFNFLGLAMIILGNNTLGNLNKEATSQESLGMACWRIMIGSGIIVFVLGFGNIATTYIFRNARLGVTARQIRSKGAVAISDREAQLKQEGKPHSIVTSFPSTYSPSAYSQQSPEKPRSPVRAWATRARESLLPSYRSQVPPYPTISSSPTKPSHSPTKTPTGFRKFFSKDKQEEVVEMPKPMQISAPMNVNPQFAHLVRPDLAHHPSQRLP